MGTTTRRTTTTTRRSTTTTTTPEPEDENVLILVLIIGGVFILFLLSFRLCQVFTKQNTPVATPAPPVQGGDNPAYQPSAPPGATSLLPSAPPPYSPKQEYLGWDEEDLPPTYEESIRH